MTGKHIDYSKVIHATLESKEAIKALATMRKNAINLSAFVEGALCDAFILDEDLLNIMAGLIEAYGADKAKPLIAKLYTAVMVKKRCA